MAGRRRHRRVWSAVALIVGGGLGVGAWAAWHFFYPRRDYGRMAGVVAQVRDELRPIEVVAGWTYPEATRAYFAYYGLDVERRIVGVEHLFGTWESSGFTLVGHVFKPPGPRATVVLVHGYLSHSGEYRHLIEAFVRAGYAVAVYDLPGHGLSTGERGSIDRFGTYSQTLADFVAVLEGLAPRPYHVVGFSTGGATVIDYVLTRSAQPFEKVILAGPLVRSAGWDASKAGYAFFSQFAEQVPRARTANSSDAAWVEFNLNRDPLQGQAVPLAWVKALFEWNKQLASCQAVRTPALVIQGTADRTVDYEYNLGFLRGKFPRARIRMIDGARHELFNESPSLRAQAIEAVLAYLEAATEVGDPHGESESLVLPADEGAGGRNRRVVKARTGGIETPEASSCRMIGYGWVRRFGG